MTACAEPPTTLRQVDLYLASLQLLRPFTSSNHTRTHISHILVRVRDADGGEGWGESAPEPDPYYSPETTETCWHLLKDFLVPGLMGQPWQHPDEAAETWRQVRGNRFAKAGLEMACWDLHTRRQGEPLAAALDGTRRAIESGVSLGIEPTPQALVRTVDSSVDQGYRRVKLKIGPGRDVTFVDAVRERWPELPLMADANSAYSLDNPAHVRALKDLDAFGLMMIEQPLADDDVVDHARLQQQLKTPICLDESIHSADDARKALDLGSCRVINVKVSRLGGLSEARRVHDLCLSRGVPVWCGGMHEFGVGRAANVAISSLPGFTLPGDISGSDRYFTRDLVEPPLRATSGSIPVPWDRPGLGYEPVLERVQHATSRHLTLRADGAVIAD